MDFSWEKLTADSCMDSGSEIRMAQTADPLFGSAGAVFPDRSLKIYG